MSKESVADQARDVVAEELERRGLEKEAVMGNNPTDSEFTGDKIPADGRSEKNELAADTVRETQSIKDRNSDQEDHDMASPILEKDAALAKVSSLLTDVRSMKTKLAEAYTDGEGMADTIPDEEGFGGDMGGMGEEPMMDEEGFEEESEYADLTPKETLQFALEDIQEAADAVLSIEDELVESNKRLKGARYSDKLAARCASVIKLAEGYLGDGRDSLNHFQNVTRKSPDGAGSTEEEIETQPQVAPYTSGAPGMSRASEDPFADTLVKARGIKRAWDGLMELTARKAADDDGSEDEKPDADKKDDGESKEASRRRSAAKDDDTKPEEDKDMSKKEKDASRRGRIRKDAAAYPPTDAEFTGDKQVSPVPQEKELSHWHEGDARGDRDVGAEGGYDINNIGDRIELYEKIKVLTSVRDRSQKNASESRWIVRGAKDQHLGDVTFADVTDDPSFTRDNYAHFLSDEYGEGLRIAVAMFGEKCLQNGFASMTPQQRQTVSDFYDSEKEQHVAADDRVKQAALNIVKAFESPEVPEKSKLVSYFTDAFGDAEYARNLVNALLDTHTKLSTIVQRGLQYREAYEKGQTRTANEVKVKRAADAVSRSC